MKTSCNYLLLVLPCILFLTVACNKPDLPVSNEALKSEVEAAIHSSIGWAKNKDLNRLYSVINDSSYLEVDPSDHVVRGIEQFKRAEAFWMDDNFKAIRYEIRDLVIHISDSKDVAWFYCKLDDINEWKGQPSNWENVRWTGVLEKKNGSWVMMQQHFSYAVNE